MPRTRPFDELKAATRAREGAEERIQAAQQRALEEIALATLRQRRGLAQAELAARLNISQPAVSSVEHGADLRLSTLRDYVAALGGRLELLAVFDDEGEPVPISIGTAEDDAGREPPSG